MSALVSIIIPVYNIEKYIANCLDSVISQTYKNLEIICVDDGSRDSSREIIKSYAEKDSRIVYIYQDNAGVSAARNKGLDCLHGEYVMFVDGDDYIHYQAVEMLTDCLEKQKCSIAFGDYKMTSSLNDIEMVSKIEEYHLLLVDESNAFDSASDYGPCGKLFHSEIFKKYQFPKGITNAEDFCLLVLIYYEYRKKIGYRIDIPLYFYYIRPESASNSKFSRNNITEITANEMIMDFIKDKEESGLRTNAVKSLFRLLLRIRTRAIGSEFEKETKDAVRASWKKWKKYLWKCNGIDFKEKILFTLFYYSRHLYELARMIQDPTMKDFYKSRNKQYN